MGKHSRAEPVVPGQPATMHVVHGSNQHQTLGLLLQDLMNREQKLQEENQDLRDQLEDAELRIRFYKLKLEEARDALKKQKKLGSGFAPLPARYWDALELPRQRSSKRRRNKSPRRQRKDAFTNAAATNNNNRKKFQVPSFKRDGRQPDVVLSPDTLSPDDVKYQCVDVDSAPVNKRNQKDKPKRSTNRAKETKETKNIMWKFAQVTINDHFRETTSSFSGPASDRTAS